MKIRPLHDRVLVRRLEPESKTAGGLIIPENAKKASLKGEVIAAGRGKILANGNLRPLDVAEGNRILFAQYSGDEIQADGETLLLLKEDDILAVVS